MENTEKKWRRTTHTKPAIKIKCDKKYELYSKEDMHEFIPIHKIWKQNDSRTLKKKVKLKFGEILGFLENVKNETLRNMN